jgi:PAS domain S-box-containing protein
MGRNKPPAHQQRTQPLRLRAEELLRSDCPDISKMPTKDVEALVHELRVHQIELELQNEDLREAQLELAESRDRFSDLYEFAPIGYLTLDTKGHVIEANLAAAAMLGVERKDLLGAPITRFVANGFQDEWYFHLRAVFAAESKQACELAMQTAKGDPLAVRLESLAHESATSETPCSRTALIDVTEVHAAQEQLQRLNEELEQRVDARTADLRQRTDQLARQSAELQRREHEFRALADNVPALFTYVDREGRFRFVNNRYAAFWQRPATELVGKTAAEVLGPELFEMARPHIEAALRGEEVVYEAEFEHDNREYTMHVRYMPDRDERGEVQGYFGLLTDITELKQTEQRLAERSDMLRLLNDVATAANEARSGEAAIEYALQRVSEHNGWCFGHAYLLEEDDPDTLVPVRTYYESAPGRFRMFRAATLKLRRLRGGQGLPGRALKTKAVQWTDNLEEELTARRAEVGRELGLVCGAAFPIFAQSEVVGVLELFSDKAIERTQRLLESMTSIGTQLGRVVERQQFERNLARAVLAEQQRLGRDLHDSVGQEMAGLAMITERMAEQARRGSPPGAHALVELSDGLRHALDETRAVVRDMLSPAAQAENLVDALREIAVAVRRRYDVLCEVDCPEPLPVDAAEIMVHLYRITSEAVANAARHAQATRIDLRAVQQDGMLVLEVHDDGVGIPEDAGGGSGLWIMQHRANVVGATLDISGRAEGGTVVRCVLPADKLRPGRFAGD